MSALSVVSIGIAGWGEASTGLPYRIRIAHTGDAGGTVVAVPLLTGHPSELSTRLDLAESWIESGSLSFNVGRIDEHAAAIALRRFLFQANPVPIGYISSDLTAAATSVSFIGSPEGSAPAVGSIIYIGREAMKVTAVSGTLTVTRAMFGTKAQTHDANPLTGDRWIYDANPIVETREVVRYDYDPATDTETARWRGILEPPALDNGLTTITVKARDSWAQVMGRMLGEGRIEFAGRLGTVETFANEERFPITSITYKGSFIATRSSPILINGTTLVLASERSVAAVPFDVATSQNGTNYLTEAAAVEDPAPLFVENELPEAPTQDERIVEVLVADKEGGYSLFRDENDALSDHPLDILLNIWTSSGGATWSGSHTKGSNGDYDWLPGHWGLGIPESEIDIAGIVALRDGIFAGLRARSFVLGIGERDAMAVCKRILQPLFLFPTYTTDGKLSLSVAVDPGPGNTAATITAGDIVGPIQSQPWSTIKRYRSSELNVGRRWPAEDYREKLIGADREAARRNREPYGKSVFEVDAGDYGDPRTGLISEKVRRGLLAVDSRRLLILRNRLPEFEIDLRPGISEIAAGQWIDLTLGVLVGEDGDRVQVDGHRCLVLDATRRPDDRVQELRVLDFFPVARANRKVLPCWRIATVAANDEFTIVSNEFTTNDAATWVNGADVNLYTKRGVLRSTDGPSFGTITGTGVLLDSEWLASAVAVTPAVGDLVMPAEYDDASVDWTDGVWIADSGEAVGTANDDPARWGL